VKAPRSTLSSRFSNISIALGLLVSLRLPSQASCRRAGFAKRTEARMLSATRKRHAHRLANEMATSVQNETLDGVQNENRDVAKSA